MEFFEIIVIATPLTLDKANITFVDFPDYGAIENATDPSLSFQRCVSTFVSGEVNHAYLNFDSAADLTASNLFIGESDVVKALAHQVPVNYTEAEMGTDIPPVWKIFSEEPLDDAELDKVRDSP